MTKITSNFIYLAIFQSYNLLIPVFIYPHLITVLDLKIWKEILIAQSVAYSLGVLINFGLDRLGVKKISSATGHFKVNEIVNEILFLRISLAIVTFTLLFVVSFFLIEKWLLYVLFFGVNFNLIFFPNWYFESLYKLKKVVILNVLIRSLFIASVFFIVKDSSDYLLFPLVISLGTFFGSIVGLIILKGNGIKLMIPSKRGVSALIKEGSYLLIPDILGLARGKGSLILLASFFSPHTITVYDIIQKLNALINQFTLFINASIFPLVCNTFNIRKYLKYMYLCVFISILYFFFMVFYQNKIFSLIGVEIQNNTHTYLLYVAPFTLSISFFLARNILLVKSMFKELLYDSYISNSIYIIGFLVIMTKLNLVNFSILLLTTYLSELIYRYVKARKFI